MKHVINNCLVIDYNSLVDNGVYRHYIKLVMTLLYHSADVTSNSRTSNGYVCFVYIGLHHTTTYQKHNHSPASHADM